MATPSLTVVMYHYVRNAAASGFPRLHALDVDTFARQVDALCDTHTPATLDIALDFLAGRYKGTRDLFLLTFDDGLKEHYANVTPILRERGLQGLFFVTTMCVEEHRVLGVHKNHFMMASIDFPAYARAIREHVLDLIGDVEPPPDDEVIRRRYRWDEPEVARFKYFLNFQLPEPTRDAVLDELFLRHFGEEATFARELYLSWDEIAAMQADGMLIGSHSHAHTPLSELGDDSQRDDLRRSLQILQRRARQQPEWPFSYPFGGEGSFTDTTVRILRDVGFRCAFARQVGVNRPGQDAFRIRRLDPKDISMTSGYQQ
jgi:peptidoglycan/xylan/chitin deacetylase (PgdA/CDA1 family)